MSDIIYNLEALQGISLLTLQNVITVICDTTLIFDCFKKPLNERNDFFPSNP